MSVLRNLPPIWGTGLALQNLSELWASGTALSGCLPASYGSQLPNLYWLESQNAVSEVPLPTVLLILKAEG